ncbi:VOC family protein [Streptomyces corynorhini]|uniref:VOC family protein n=1 Tax=Streptomyces corynorhini TaxID=2282652 RepID=A0A370BBC0_9ACTN|nr:VOC family protein [Streptomyces corynorhini]RDG36725.1 VOC family protein [Streptomyces corynorhini]
MAAFAESTPCWVDVSLPDLEAGKRFYGELFGWTFSETSDTTAGRGAEAFREGRRVAGLVAKKDGRMPTTWGVYFATADIVGLSRRITAAGGTLVRGPLALGRSASIAQAADPAGTVFGIRQAGDDPGFERTGLPGSFCWTELYTRDKARVDPFYESVLGFRGTDLPGAAIDFRMWSPPGAEPGEAGAIGGRSVITDAFPAELPGHFLCYFSVADCDETAATAVRLGGRVTAPPFGIPHGRMSVLVDNQGASFAVLSGAADPVGPKGGAGAEAGPEPE